MASSNSAAWDHVAKQSVEVRDDVHRQVIERGWYQNSSASPSVSMGSRVDQQEPAVEGVDVEGVEPEPVSELYGETRDAQPEAGDLYGEGADTEEVTASDLYGSEPEADTEAPDVEPGLEP